MSFSSVALQESIDQAWEQRTELSTAHISLKEKIDAIIADLDAGKIRVCEKLNGKWVTHQWIKKAILLSFRLNPNKLLSHGPNDSPFFDKVGLKFQNWTEQDFETAKIRAVPGTIVRQGAYIGPNVVLMPSFVNIGAHIGANTLVDTWATVGSCAQIGANCHISGGAGIGGVLEPLQANPVIIEDHCFIGARAEVAEGVIVEEGAVLSMGVYLGASTKIIDRETGQIHMGRVPAYSVIVPGTMPIKQNDPANPQPSLYCAVIVKKVDAQTRAKTSINELLRT
jgi:2,3,4,5-tetrahydropyridine-2-carboxylate N-succinyltransferase